LKPGGGVGRRERLAARRSALTRGREVVNSDRFGSEFIRRRPV
jgi:hypothetical protein